MLVLLVRHGAAVDPYQAPVDDLRWLTAEGRARTRAVGRALAVDRGLRFTAMYTSPLVRAVQTTEILAGAQDGFTGPVTVHGALAPERGTTAQALAPLDRHGPDDVVALVGHEPKIRILAGHLAGLGSFPGFRTTQAVLVEVEDGVGRFRWTQDPRTLAVVEDPTTPL